MPWLMPDFLQGIAADQQSCLRGHRVKAGGLHFTDLIPATRSIQSCYVSWEKGRISGLAGDATFLFYVTEPFKFLGAVPDYELGFEVILVLYLVSIVDYVQRFVSFRHLCSILPGLHSFSKAYS